VLMHEGGLVSDPADPGGLTNWGISLKAYPQLGAGGIRTLTREGAAELYERDYWQAICGDDLPAVVAVVAMDAAVNCGPPTVRQWIRQAIGFEANGSSELGEAVFRSARAEPLDIAQRITLSRLWRYDNLVAKHPPLVKYLRGWRRRTIETLTQAVIYATSEVRVSEVRR